MKTLSILILCAILVLPAAVPAADQIKQVDRPEGLPSFLGYKPNEFIVVMKTEAGVLRPGLSQSGIPRVGDSAFDMISEQFAVSGLRQQFPGSEPSSGSPTAELSKYHKVRIETGSLEEAMLAYASHPLVERVEPIGIHAMYATPNDTYYDPYQHYHNQANDHDIDSPEAWDIQTGSTSVIVADLDSGTRYYHPDLGGVNASPGNPGASRGNIWINNAELNGSAGVDDDGNGYTDDWIGYDFIDGVSNCWSGEDCNTKDNDPRDFNGHGTHTAGIVAMLTNDGYGMAGTAGGWGNGSQAVNGNGVKLMVLRMGYSYNYLGQEYGVVMMDAAAEAFYYAADNGAKIATCSWGSSNSGGIGAAASYFLNSGGLIFVAAGNDGTQTADYLNGRGDCISVAAVDQNDAAASFTTYGTWVDICAPGVGIYATYHDHADPNTNYWAALDGTSMATPMAAAVGALIWSQNPGWTASQVENQLYASADNIDAYLATQYHGKMGAGRINSHNAVNTGPPPAPVAEFSGSPTSGTEPLSVSFTDLSTGSIDTWSWTFGDGGTSSSQNPNHTYTSAGSYSVSLTVSGPGGSDGETKNNYITVNPCVAPTADFTAAPTSGEAPLAVSFTDLSTGSPASWSWTFGDGGTSTAQNPNHSYTAAGIYSVTLTASNACGSDGETKTDYITVTEPTGGGWVTITYDDFEGGFGNYSDGGSDCYLYTGGSRAHQGSNAGGIQDNSGTASSFTHSSGHDVTGYVDLEVEFWFYANSMETGEDFWVQYFDGSAWHTVASYARGVDFNNNVFYNKVVPIPAGSYSYPANAQLRFRCDASGNGDDVYIDEIEFRGFDSGGGPTPPTAAFSGTPTSGNYPLNVSFTDESTGSPDSWSWTFGDGGTSSLQNPSHIYGAVGTYTVSLTVSNSAGSDGEIKTDYITVTEPGGGGWVTITYDDFEGGWGSYVDGGGDCALYTGGTYAHQGSNAAEIRDNSGVASSFYHAGAHDVSGFSELEVEFWYLPVSMDNTAEDFWVQYFDGSAWQTVAVFARNTDFVNGVFYNEVVAIPSGTFTYPNNAKLRFMCDASGNRDWIYLDEIEFRGFSGTAGEGGAVLLTEKVGEHPGRFTVAQNYPNPFNPTTTIEFSLPAPARVEVSIFDITGRRIADLARGDFGSGVHRLRWNAEDFASGTYLYRIRAGEEIVTKRMVLLK